MLGGIAAGAAYYFGKDKVKGYSQALENLSFNLKSVKNINFDGLGGLSLKADVQIVNPSNLDLSIPGSMINIQQIEFFTKSGQLLGTANTNINNIAISAQGTKLLQNIPVQIPISQALGNISELLDIVGDSSNLNIATTIEIFGKQFTL